MVITKDNRFIKILEVLPVNFYLKSPSDQQNIITSYAAYLKIAPDITKKGYIWFSGYKYTHDPRGFDILPDGTHGTSGFQIGRASCRERVSSPV